MSFVSFRSTVRLAALAGIVVLGIAGTGCSTCADVSGFFVEPSPDLESPNVYRDAQLAFYYPGNWTAKRSGFNEGGVSVSVVEVESAGNAYLALQVFTPAVPVGNADELLESATQEMINEVSQTTGGLVTSSIGGTTDVSRQLLGAPRPGKRRGLTVTVLGETVPSTLEIYGVELPQASLIVISSGADEDMAKLGPGYAQVLDSLQLLVPATAPVPQPAAPAGTQAF